MTLSQVFLPEFEHEMAGVRRCLERVPAAQLEFRPHPKSFTLGALSNHLATMPTWVASTLELTELDFSQAATRAMMPEPCTTVEGLLATFDQAMADAKKGLAAASDEVLMTTWTGKNQGQVVFALPRMGVLRSFILNHAIHHRGQMTVYLRLLDVPVPALYGPSADEG